MEELTKQGVNHLRFCTKLYKMQMDQGMYFLHEQPKRERYDDDHTLDNLMKDWRVYSVEGEMNKFVMERESEMKERSIREEVKLVTNAEMIAGRLARKCIGGKQQTRWLNKRFSSAEVYPEDLCKEVIRGLQET